MHPDFARFFKLDADLRVEASQVLVASGIGAILDDFGCVSVGSRIMRTMAWRDLDFERVVDEPNWDEHWELATRIARSGWCTSLECADVYREQWADYGFYLGVMIADPARTGPVPKGDPSVWKLDVWTRREHEFAAARGPRARWAALMTEEARSHIIAIKETLQGEGRYGRPVLSVHVYEAVLERGIRAMPAFNDWWTQTHGDGSKAAS